MSCSFHWLSYNLNIIINIFIDCQIESVFAVSGEVATPTNWCPIREKEEKVRQMALSANGSLRGLSLCTHMQNI